MHLTDNNKPCYSKESLNDINGSFASLINDTNVLLTMSTNRMLSSQLILLMSANSVCVIV